MKTLPIFIAAFLMSGILTNVKSQDKAEFNRVFSDTYLNVSKYGLNKALERADSLYMISETPVFKTKSLMLSASLYQQGGEIDKAIEYALKAEEVIKKTDDYFWRTRVYGFLATQNRILKLYEQSKHFTLLAIENVSKIKEPELSMSTEGILNQELAYYEIEKKNYQKAVEHLETAESLLAIEGPNMDYLRANNYRMMGTVYYRMQNYEKSLEMFKLSLKESEDIDGDYIKGLIYSGVSEVYTATGDFESAKEYLDEAFKIEKESNLLELSLDVYSSAEKYYKAIKDFDNLVKVTRKQDSLNLTFSELTSSFVDHSYSELDKENKRLSSGSKKKNTTIIIGGLLIMGLTVYFFYFRRKKKREIENFKIILSELKDDSNAKTGSTEAENLSVRSENEELMTDDTRQKLLDKLDRFEKLDLYTNKHTSLSSLAVYCETNTKYLSHVINTHKEMDFNNYINNLRVRFVINKLTNDKVYRRYKISVLADEAGFSSQNKFSSVFKKFTMISPSSFIRLLEEGNSI